ncbi:hypothetical protein O9993_15250 [Vibrio lentus]|nr:hypothetical protein [Vibrio lentus]
MSNAFEYRGWSRVRNDDGGYREWLRDLMADSVVSRIRAMDATSRRKKPMSGVVTRISFTARCSLTTQHLRGSNTAARRHPRGCTTDAGAAVSTRVLSRASVELNHQWI